MSRKNKYGFNDEKGQAELVAWWRDLEAHKGERAQLRRAGDLLSVMLCPGFHDLRLAMSRHGYVESQRLAVVAGVLAHLRNEVKKESFAKTMAKPKAKSQEPRVSGLRFRRFLQIQADDYKGREELMRTARRALALAENTADPVSLAKDIYFWGAKTKRIWAEDYYDTAKNAD